ncbi:MAG: hypothetical protein H7296_14990 [Bacteroidia bacterium]|nr:hypothetical protein [Bacteroidia bacterium]
MKAKKYNPVFIICLVILLFFSACNQRFFFRKKIDIGNDSTQMEKDYHIVW